MKQSDANEKILSSLHICKTHSASLFVSLLIWALLFPRFLLIMCFSSQTQVSAALSTVWSCRAHRKLNDCGLSLLPAAVTDGLTALDEWRSPPRQAETNARVGGDSAAKHQPSILWGLATVMSQPLGSVEGQGGRGRLMRAERDNVMEREWQSWWGNEGKERVSAVSRKAHSSNLCPLERVQLNLSAAFYSHSSNCGAAGERPPLSAVSG